MKEKKRKISSTLLYIYIYIEEERMISKVNIFFLKNIHLFREVNYELLRIANLCILNTVHYQSLD